jgi:hypothetical protein
MLVMLLIRLWVKLMRRHEWLINPVAALTLKYTACLLPSEICCR